MHQQSSFRTFYSAAIGSGNGQIPPPPTPVHDMLAQATMNSGLNEYLNPPRATAPTDPRMQPISANCTRLPHPLARYPPITGTAATSEKQLERDLLVTPSPPNYEPKPINNSALINYNGSWARPPHSEALKTGYNPHAGYNPHLRNLLSSSSTSSFKPIQPYAPTKISDPPAAVSAPSVAECLDDLQDMANSVVTSTQQGSPKETSGSMEDAGSKEFCSKENSAPHNNWDQLTTAPDDSGKKHKKKHKKKRSEVIESSNIADGMEKQTSKQRKQKRSTPADDAPPANDSSSAGGDHANDEPEAIPEKGSTTASNGKEVDKNANPAPLQHSSAGCLSDNTPAEVTKETGSVQMTDKNGKKASKHRKRKSEDQAAGASAAQAAAKAPKNDELPEIQPAVDNAVPDPIQEEKAKAQINPATLDNPQASKKEASASIPPKSSSRKPRKPKEPKKCSMQMPPKNPPKPRVQVPSKKPTKPGPIPPKVLIKCGIQIPPKETANSATQNLPPKPLNSSTENTDDPSKSQTSDTTETKVIKLDNKRFAVEEVMPTPKSGKAGKVIAQIIKIERINVHEKGDLVPVNYRMELVAKEDVAKVPIWFRGEGIQCALSKNTTVFEVVRD